MRRPIMAVLTAAAFAFAGCGDDDDSDTTAETSAAPPPAAGSNIDVDMTDFTFEPADVEVDAGKVTITSENVGKQPHELVVLDTDAPAAKLPMKGDEVDESSSVGEIPETESGETGKETFDLKTGKYVMVCALPGHYEAGMYGTITVR